MITQIIDKETSAGKKIGPYDLNKIYCGDCITLSQRLPTKSVDLVLTDPPFAIDFKGRRSNYNRTASRVVEGYYAV